MGCLLRQTYKETGHTADRGRTGEGMADKSALPLLSTLYIPGLKGLRAAFSQAQARVFLSHTPPELRACSMLIWKGGWSPVSSTESHLPLSSLSTVRELWLQPYELCDLGK